MMRVLAIARLTLREGIRMRIVLVFLVLLLLLIIYMPFALRGDETVAGRLQQFLSYGLGALSLLLSLATIFFSCATLTTEFRERSLQLVVTKPVSRAAILAGKWLGVNLLNVIIVAICGAAIYGFAYYLKTRPTDITRDRMTVTDVVWTSRYAQSPTVPTEFMKLAEERVQEAIRTGDVPAEKRSQAYHEEYRKLIQDWCSIETATMGVFEFNDLKEPGDPNAVIQIRYKARASPLTPDEHLQIGWLFVDPNSGDPFGTPRITDERSGDLHQFLVRSGVIRGGSARLVVLNPYSLQRPTSIIFEQPSDLQILYRAEPFELNFIKALVFVLLRLSLLSAIGLTFGVFVSFPVAALCTGAFYLICLGYPFWMDAIGANLQLVTPQIDPYGSLGPIVRTILVTFVQAVFPNFHQYDGTRLLVDGEYISYTLLLGGVLRTLVYGMGLLTFGWLVFKFREVAEVTV